MTRSPEIGQRRRLRGYLALARVSNSPTVVTNVMAAAALAGAAGPGTDVALLTVAMVAFYTAGMFLNDLCDHAIDRRQRPDRPLPSGAVSQAEVAVVAAALFVAGEALLLRVGAAPFWSGLVLVATIVVYDLWHKTNPLSPVLMAATRVLVYATVFLAFSPDDYGSLAVVGGLLGVYIVGLTYVAKSEAGPRLANYWPVAALLAPVVYLASQTRSAWMLLVVLLFAGWIAYSVSFVYRAKGRDVGGAVARLIAGVALYDGAVLAMSGSLPGAVLALAAFVATLFLQRYVRGT
ncbi:MAG: UbiA family prenyltransferase [Rubrobacter sp.]